MNKKIILAKAPELVLKLEKYGLLPELKKQGSCLGCAKKWAKEKIPPYDDPEFQALAERLPIGWEELTENEMQQLLFALNQKIEEKKKAELDIPNKGCEKILGNLTHLFFLALSTLTTIFLEKGVGILPGGDEQEEQKAKELSFELMLHFLGGTKFLKRFFRSVAEMTNTSRENQELIGDVLTAIALLIVIETASKGDENKRNSYFLNFRHFFNKEIEKIEKFISEKIMEGSISGDSAEKGAFSLKQLHMAVEKGDYAGFQEALSNILSSISVPIEPFLRDIKEIQKFANSMQNMIQTLKEDQSNQKTVVSQAM